MVCSGRQAGVNKFTMRILKSLRWRFRTWLNNRFWSRTVIAVKKPITSKIIVGLTTSPTRIKLIEPVLRSILSQSCQPDEIHLNIPPVFKRDGTSYTIPETLTKIDTRIKIIRTEDIGPGTKIIPSLLALDNTSDTLVITADDDILMLPRTIEVLADAFREDNSAVYGLSGYNLTLDLVPLYSNELKSVEVLEGYAHFAVHRKFISADFFNYIKIAHEIRAGFLHDDIVLANYFAFRNISRVQLYDQRANRKILRTNGAQLYYGIDLDALHKGAGETETNPMTAPQTQQARSIARHLEPKGLWALGLH